MYGGHLPVTGFSGLIYVAVGLGLAAFGAVVGAGRWVAARLK